MDIIKIDGIKSVVVAQDATSVAKRDGLLEQAAKINGVTNDQECTAASNLLKEVVALKREVEKTRKDVKAPALDLGRKIDAVAADFARPIETVESKLRGIVSEYLAEQARIAEQKERERQAELARIERERQASEAEARRKEQEAERARLDAERKAREAETKAQLEAASAERQRLMQAQDAARAAADEARKRAEAETAKVIATAAPTSPKVQGVTAKKVWTFDVVDPFALAKFSLTLVRVEADKRAIQSAIDAGARNIPGLRIYETTFSTVRI